jgi:hypothetical protein
LSGFWGRGWVYDIAHMHAHYGFHEKIKELGPDKLKMLLEFRIHFLEEEMKELVTADGPEDVVDALIDLCVVAIGTLDLFEVDAEEAWRRVHAANMAKKAGIKPNRPNPLGLPDLMKPEGWVAPFHDGNHGRIPLDYFK